MTEHAVIVWNSGLTKKQVNDIERVQKVAFKIILGCKYVAYEQACAYFHVLTLAERRHNLCTKFAVKLYKSKRCDQFFKKLDKNVRTRQKRLVLETRCRTKRGYKAPHHYLTRLVNQNYDKIVKAKKSS